MTSPNTPDAPADDPNHHRPHIVHTSSAPTPPLTSTNAPKRTRRTRRTIPSPHRQNDHPNHGEGTLNRSTRAPSGPDITPDRLLTVAEVAERLGTTERFPRRLIAERRITFVKLGTGRRAPVRIPESAVNEFIAAATVQAAG